MLNRYAIRYHIKPDGDDIIITIPAKSEEDAAVFAKAYRKDGFSIAKKDRKEAVECLPR